MKKIISIAFAVVLVGWTFCAHADAPKADQVQSSFDQLAARQQAIEDYPHILALLNKLADKASKETGTHIVFHTVGPISTGYVSDEEADFKEVIGYGGPYVFDGSLSIPKGRIMDEAKVTGYNKSKPGEKLTLEVNSLDAE